jgi:predicted Zn-dependent peptidase
MKTRVPFVLLALCLAGAALAADRPKVTLPDKVAAAEMRSFKLDNGLEVVVLPYGDVPKVTVMLAIDAGNLDEKANEVWLGDLTGKLLEQGTTDLDAGAMARTVAEWGGEININVGPDTIAIGGTVLAEHAPKLVELLSQLVEKPRLPESEVPRLQADLLRQVTIARTLPQQLAQEKLLSLLYPGQAYGRTFPTEAMIKGYGLPQVKAFLAANVHAGRSHLYVAGKLDGDVVDKAVRDAFGDC